VTILRENGLEIALPDGAIGRKFDGPEHGLSHCMKAVDFVVEMPNRTYFIEVKDPDGATDAERQKDFAERLASGKIDDDLKTKFRDTWLYEWAARRTKKPIYYLILIASEGLSGAELSTRKAFVERKLPLDGPLNQAWARPIVHGCAVFNIAAWNRSLPSMPVRRI
jgi:hypothetical protein